MWRELVYGPTRASEQHLADSRLSERVMAHGYVAADVEWATRPLTISGWRRAAVMRQEYKTAQDQKEYQKQAAFRRLAAQSEASRLARREFTPTEEADIERRLAEKFAAWKRANGYA